MACIFITNYIKRVTSVFVHEKVFTCRMLYVLYWVKKKMRNMYMQTISMQESRFEIITYILKIINTHIISDDVSYLNLEATWKKHTLILTTYFNSRGLAPKFLLFYSFQIFHYCSGTKISFEILSGSVLMLFIWEGGRAKGE